MDLLFACEQMCSLEAASPAANKNPHLRKPNSFQMLQRSCSAASSASAWIRKWCLPKKRAPWSFCLASASITAYGSSSALNSRTRFSQHLGRTETVQTELSQAELLGSQVWVHLLSALMHKLDAKTCLWEQLQEIRARKITGRHLFNREPTHKSWDWTSNHQRSKQVPHISQYKTLLLACQCQVATLLLFFLLVSDCLVPRSNHAWASLATWACGMLINVLINADGNFLWQLCKVYSLQSQHLPSQTSGCKHMPFSTTR